MTWAEIAAQLAEPFPASAVSWRAGSVSRDKKRAQALPYAEPRVYEDRLNEVLGPDWAVRFVTWGDQRLICELTIRVAQEDGTFRDVTRTSTGEFDGGDKIAQGTVAEAQAFKRACSKFGLGRYLYDLPIKWVGYDESTRKLTETPSLPQPTAPVRTEEPAPEMPLPHETLSAKRAEAMAAELEKLGLGRHEQLPFARRFVKYTVRALSDLTETDANRIWNAAKRVER